MSAPDLGYLQYLAGQYEQDGSNQLLWTRPKSHQGQQK